MNQPPALRETQVMGRDAVLVMLGISAVVGALSMVGVDVSGVVADLGDGFYRTAWGATLLAAGLLAFGALIPKAEDDRAWIECGALVLHAAAAGAYGWAAVDQTANVHDVLFVGGYILAAIINCLGRIRLLIRRVRWVRRQVNT